MIVLSYPTNKKLNHNIVRFYICIKFCSWQVIGHRGSRCVGGHIPGARVSPGAPEPGENVVLPALSVHGNVWRRQQWKIRCHHNRKGKQWSVLYINYVNTEVYTDRYIDLFVNSIEKCTFMKKWNNLSWLYSGSKEQEINRHGYWLGGGERKRSQDTASLGLPEYFEALGSTNRRSRICQVSL